MHRLAHNLAALVINPLNSLFDTAQKGPHRVEQCVSFSIRCQNALMTRVTTIY